MKKILGLLTAFLILCAGTAQAFDQIRASHILVPTQKEAIEIKKDIDNGGNFETYATMYSTCPSKQNGGDLGWFGQGQMVKPFETAAFNLPVGKVSEPVRTQFGWHLIKVTGQK